MSLMFRFLLSLCVLLTGGLARPCSHHGSHYHKTEFSTHHNKQVLVCNAPAPGKKTTSDEVCAIEIEEDDNPVPSRKELKPVFNEFITPVYQSLKASNLSCEYFTYLSSPSFIVHCVFRI